MDFFFPTGDGNGRIACRENFPNVSQGLVSKIFLRFVILFFNKGEKTNDETK